MPSSVAYLTANAIWIWSIVHVLWKCLLVLVPVTECCCVVQLVKAWYRKLQHRKKLTMKKMRFLKSRGRAVQKRSILPTWKVCSPLSQFADNSGQLAEWIRHTYYHWHSIIHSLFHSRLKSFSANPPYHSLSFFSFRIHYIDFPDCLLLLLSISVFLLFSFFSVFTLF